MIETDRDKVPNGAFPLVAIVVPTRNRLALLRETVDSVLKQTLTKWQLVLVDDCSEDGTFEWAMGLKDPRITSIRLSQHLERSAARNHGLADTDAGFVIFLDDDDRLFPYALETLVSELTHCPSAVGAVGARVLFDSYGGRMRSDHPRLRLTRVVWKEVLAGWAPVHGQCLFRTDAVREAGGYDLRFNVAEDHALWLKLARLGPVVVVPDKVLEYRVRAGHQDSNMQTVTLQVRQEFIATLAGVERRSAGRLLEAWGYWDSAGSYSACGRFLLAFRAYSSVVRTVPGLLYSPITGPLLAKAVVRTLLGVVIGHRGLRGLGRLKEQLSHILIRLFRRDVRVRLEILLPVLLSLSCALGWQ